MPATVSKRRVYSQAEIDHALTALILNGGNAERTADELNGPCGQTLLNWREKHSSRYQELQQTLAPRIADRIAAQAEELAVEIAQVEKQILEHLATKISDLDADKASAAIRNLSTSKALQLDKVSSPLRGRPTVIHETRTGDDLLRGLASKVGMAVDSTAEPIQDAEVVSGEIPLVGASGFAKARKPESLS